MLDQSRMSLYWQLVYPPVFGNTLGGLADGDSRALSLGSGVIARYVHRWYIETGIIRPSGKIASRSGSVWQPGAVYMPGYGDPGEEYWKGKIQASGVPGHERATIY